MKRAPIVLFVYNRPWHTEMTLNALAQNELARDSVLIIYADGPKENASREALFCIEETRKVIRKNKWCKEVRIIEAEQNKGLAESVINGITQVLKEFDRVIVLEDDIVTAKGFLAFMNEGLNLYAENAEVAGVSAWSFPISTDEKTYFSRVGACWGWGTWKRVWEHAKFDTAALIEMLTKRKLIHSFNVEGAYDYFGMLEKQASKNVDSWAIRFYANYFLNKQLFLFPESSLVQNIGFDGSGTHHSDETNQQIPVFKKQFVDLDYIAVVEKPSIRKKIIASLGGAKKDKFLFIKKIVSRFKKK